MSHWTRTIFGGWGKGAFLSMAAAGVLVMAGCGDEREPLDPQTLPAVPEQEAAGEATATLVLREVEQGEELEPYPLDVCIVAGGPLDGMGGPVTRAYGDQEVKFCCAGCFGTFESDPEGHLAKLESD